MLDPAGLRPTAGLLPCPSDVSSSNDERASASIVGEQANLEGAAKRIRRTARFRWLEDNVTERLDAFASSNSLSIEFRRRALAVVAERVAKAVLLRLQT